MKEQACWLLWLVGLDLYSCLQEDLVFSPGSGEEKV